MNRTRKDRERRPAPAGPDAGRLLQAARALHRTLRTETILRELVRAGMRLAEAPAGMVGVVEGAHLRFKEYHRGRSIELIDFVLDRQEHATGRALRTRRSYVSNDPGRDPIVQAKLRRALQIGRLASVPIPGPGGELRGCLELHRRTDDPPFVDREIRLLEEIAAIAAVALSNAARLEDCARTQSDLALAHRESMGVFQGIQQPALVLDPGCTVLAANRAMTRIAGRRGRSLVGMNCQDVYRESADHCSVCPLGMQPHATTLASSPRERTLGRRSLLVSCTAIRDNHGAVERIIQVGTDITDRKRMEQELVREHDRAQSYLRIAGVMIVAIDRNQRVTLVNRKACELLGAAEGEILGRNWFDHYIPRLERRRVKAGFDALMRGELAPVEYFENRVVSRDKSERLIAWHNTILRNDDGRIVGTLSSGTDITESRRAEEELRALNETLEARVAERTKVAEQRAQQLRVLARELTEAELRERRRIAQLLHEHFQQHLAAARVHLGLLARHPLDDRSRPVVQKVDDILKESIGDSRSLAVDLCPPVLYELGLGPALDWLAGRMFEAHGLQVQVENLSTREPGDANLRAFIFEAVRELLFNVVKHAQADRANVTMDGTDRGVLRVVVRDAGVGFSVPPDAAVVPSEGFGLFSIRERLASLGGWSEVESRRGRGTRVTLCAPMGE